MLPVGVTTQMTKMRKPASLSASSSQRPQPTAAWHSGATLNMSQESSCRVTQACPKCGAGMVIHSTTRQLTALEKYLPLNSWTNLWVAGWLSFLVLPLQALGASGRRKVEDHLQCPECGEVGPTVPVAVDPDTPSAPRRNLRVLLSPDFIGSAIVVATLTVLLITLIVSQPIGDLLSKGGLLLIGFLVAAILFLTRIMLLPFWRKARTGDPR